MPVAWTSWSSRCGGERPSRSAPADHVALRLEIVTDSPPDVVLVAIREHAAYSQEHLVPDDLRLAGAKGVEVHVDGERFRLWLSSRRRRPPSEYALRGSVTARAEGGSQVEATAVGLSHKGMVAGLGAALVAVLVLMGSWRSGVLVAMVCAMFIWRQWRGAQSLTRETDRGIQHLAERLELALRTLEEQPTHRTARRRG